MRLTTVAVFGMFFLALPGVEGSQKQSKAKGNSKVPVFVDAEFSNDIPDEVRNSLLDVQQRRRKAFDSLQKSLAEAQQHLKMAQRGRIDPSHEVISTDSRNGMYTFGNKSQKSNTIKEKEKRVLSLEEQLAETAGNSLSVPAFERKIRKGDIGVVTTGMKVKQVVSPNAILAEAWIAEQNETILISGIDSSGLTDDTGFTLALPLLVKGTKSYTTVLGAQRTVFELAPFEIEDYVSNRPELNAKPQDKQRKPAKN
jgi:hypothetical protein